MSRNEDQCSRTTREGGDEPPLEPQGAVALLASALDDDVAFLARAATGSERAMYYALGSRRSTEGRLLVGPQLGGGAGTEKA